MFDLIEQLPLSQPLLILGVLCANVALAEWLCRTTPLRHLGTALVVILITAVAANLRLIPTSGATPIYGFMLGPVVQLAVFWILLQVNLRELMKAGIPMISMFLVGSVGTLVGVIVGMLSVNGAAYFDGHHDGLSAMFVGTYTGGSINFNAMAVEYKVSETGDLFAGAVVVDNIMTTVWMVVTIAVPRGIGFLKQRTGSAKTPLLGAVTGQHEDTETVHPMDIALLVAIGAAAVGVSDGLAWLASEYMVAVPSMLFLTVIALVLAQTPLVSRLPGTRALGLFSVYLFLAVIGALCDLQALRGLEVGLRLLTFVAVAVAVHGVIIFSIGAIFKVDRDIVAVASQANIGGGTSAMAIARSLGRPDLVLPAILVGSLGTALGNFLGLLAGQLMAAMHP